MGTINVDRVTGYALTKQDRVIGVDKVTAYALVASRPATSGYTIDYKQYIANSIKATHNVSFSVNDFDLGTPVTKNAGRFNAEIPFSARPSSGYSGTINLAYLRYPISDLVEGRDLDAFKYVPGAKTTRDMVDVFNVQFGTQLARTEIVDAPLNPSGDTIFIASPDSVFFEPGGKLNVGVLAPSARDHELKGLVWPDAVAMYPAMTTGLDFSDQATLFNNLPTTGNGGVLAQTSANTIGLLANQLGGYTFFTTGQSGGNLGSLQGGLAKTITLPDPAYPQCDQTGRFARAMILTPPSAKWWYTEPFIFHYNP